MYHLRLLVCSYGEMIATTTHEFFAAFECLKRHVLVSYKKHKHTHIYTHTHTETGQQVDISSTAHFLELREIITSTTHETFATIVPPQRQLYVRYTNTHKNTHRERPASPCTTPATCLQLRRNDCNYHASEFCCTCAPTAASPC
jgi:hypothetical protein